MTIVGGGRRGTAVLPGYTAPDWTGDVQFTQHSMLMCTRDALCAGVVP